jgi:hypothetical protein
MTYPDKLSLEQPAIYIIEVQGRLAADWSNHFSGMTLEVFSASSGNSISRLTGVLADQPALHGVLQKIRDYNLLLLRVEFIKAAPETTG